MCDCDDNYCITGGGVNRKARKDHKCCECRRIIKAGETYEYFSGLWRDSGFGDFKTCSHCLAAKDLCRVWDKDACICFEGLADYLWEYRGDLAYHVYKSHKGFSWLDVLRVYRGVDSGWKYKRGPRKGQLRPLPCSAVQAGVEGVPG
jgi:hypothetical protein